MKYTFTRNTILLTALFICYTLFLAGFIFSIRALSSISTGLLIFLGLLLINKKILPAQHTKAEMLFLSGCVIFFSLQLVSLLYTHNITEGWKNIQLKSGLIFIPAAVLLTLPLRSTIQKRIFQGYCILLISAFIYCFGRAVQHYSNIQLTTFFFYHELVKPIEQHAVYFSIYVISAIVLILESARKGSPLFTKPFNAIVTVVLSVFLFLLASRFIIAFYLIYMSFYFIQFYKKRKTKKFIKTLVLVLACAIAGSLLFSNNEVSRRYKDLWKGNIEIVSHEKFKTSDYFNGIQFRLLQWRLVFEILNEKKSWWSGVSAGDAQDLLNDKYVEKNIYTGDPARGDRGFLNYNTHNQLLESLLQNGIPGLLAYLFIIFCLVKLATQNKDRALTCIIITVIIYSLIESVFETQYGILIFTFLPLFIQTGSSDYQLVNPVKRKKKIQLTEAIV